jgi:nucleoside-diphosphate-sugar epimerase
MAGYCWHVAVPGDKAMSCEPTILLTGATGFIGSHVLEALTGAGLRVRALVRAQANGPQLEGAGAEVALGDVRDLPSLERAVRGCSQVIHVAGLARDWGKRADFVETNVTGTRNVLEASRRAGVSHVIITGSISSYGEEDSENAKNELCPYRSHYPYLLDKIFPCALNWYRDSKAAATSEAAAFAREHNLALTILEPAWVYGEREFETGFYSYIKTVQSGQRFMPGSTRNRFHVVYAKDLAQAYVLAAQKRLPGVERIIVGTEHSEWMHQIFATFCREAGLPPPRLLPKWSTYPVGFVLELACTLAGSRQPPTLTRGRVNTFYDSISYSTDKARRLLGFRCDYSLEQGIRQTVAWYKNNHYL